MKQIVVVGSINMDMVNRVHKHPLPGETVKGLGTVYSPGGKGANQAAAASLAGGQVRMLGAVGRDPFGQELKSTLLGFGVNVDCVLEKEGTSGLAFITVDDSGENLIILSEGANGLLSRQDVESFLSVVESSDAVLLQNEIPWEATVYVMEQAKQGHASVFFNPAPALQVPQPILSMVDVLVLNETEAEVIAGFAVTGLTEAERAADLLLEAGVGEVVLTLGEKGSLYKSNQERICTPAFSVTAVDTTAAGDTFIGALAVARGFGLPITEQLRFASAAAALAVGRQGAQKSIPAHEEIEAFLALHRREEG